MSIYENIIQLSKDTMSRYQPDKLKWMWGEALLMHSFGLLAEQNPEIDYDGYIKAYIKHHIEKGYRVDQSDTLAPALAAYYIYKKESLEEYKVIIDKAIDYILNSEKIIENMPNHLGHSLEGKFYPKSIWVDSIMMYGVFTSLYARENNNQELMDFAKTQPGFFAKYLQDDKEKLFYHCYWTRKGKPYPKNIFWGRGNGWVIQGLPMLIDNLTEGKEKEVSLKILKETAKSILKYQRADGFFETVLNKVGKTYAEASATALIASGFLHSIRMNYLDSSYLEPAMRALKAVVESLEIKSGLLSMPNISAPTIPLPIFPYLGYKLTPVGNDWTYGLAALNFAAYNLKKGGFKDA